ncbi:hypothetical protein ACWCXX_37565 [Streptomyces sp. NPDC001732]
MHHVVDNNAGVPPVAGLAPEPHVVEQTKRRLCSVGGGHGGVVDRQRHDADRAVLTNRQARAAAHRASGRVLRHQAPTGSHTERHEAPPPSISDFDHARLREPDAACAEIRDLQCALRTSTQKAEEPFKCLPHLQRRIDQLTPAVVGRTKRLGA